MTRLEFFLKAMIAEEYRRTAWVISAFSLILEAPDAYKTDPYPYRIVQSPAGLFFVDPENGLELTKIDDYEVGKPPFDMREAVSIKAGDVPNLTIDADTTYGRILWNYLVLVYPFGTKIPYQNKKMMPGHVENMIVDRLVDDPEVMDEAAIANTRVIYVSEYLKYTNAAFATMAYAQLCVPACTRKTMTAPPDIIALRTQLLEENKGKLTDPATIARIDARLVQHLKNWMKGDEGEDFLINSKSYNVVRRKQFAMGGADPGLDDKVEVDLVTKSFSEGWDPEKFATMNTVSRAGSFNRGAQTELGGEAVKWLLRASSNMTITSPDCGTTMGLEFLAQKGEEKKLIGFTAITPTGQVKITNENVGEYMGKRTVLRSPMYCKNPKTDFCSACLGDRLSASPTGLSTAVADYGSAFLALFMKAMHSSELRLEKVDYRTVFH